MRIRVVQSGGLAGLRSEHELDTDQLPAEAREALARLIEGLAFFTRPPQPASKLPDMIHYRVRIEEGARAHEVTFDDGCDEATLLELVDRVAELARERP